MPTVGQLVAGRYVVGAPRGEGMMGIVVEAFDRQRGAAVALKILRPEVQDIPQIAERLLREGRIISQLTTEHVVKVFDVGVTESGLPYFSMELLEGHDLAEHLGRGREFSIGEAIHYVRQACEGVAEAHAHGIIHRDLKPHNLFLTTRDDGSPRITILDFGISKELDTAVELTLTQTSLGTPLYMSPEQVRSAKNIDERSDVWALAVVLFELITGRPPFDGESSHAVTASIVADPPLRLRELVADAPEELERVLLQAMEKDPRKRIQSAKELARALLPFDEDPTEHTPLREHPTLVQTLPRSGYLDGERTQLNEEKTAIRAVQPSSPDDAQQAVPARPQREMPGEMTLPWTRRASSAPPGVFTRPEPPTPKLDAPTPRLLPSNLPGRAISPNARTILSSSTAQRREGMSGRSLALIALATLVSVLLVSALIYGGVQRRRKLAQAAASSASSAAAAPKGGTAADLLVRAATDGGAVPFEACVLGDDDALRAIGPDTPKLTPLSDIDAIVRGAEPPSLVLDLPGSASDEKSLVLSAVTALSPELRDQAVPVLLVSDQHFYLGLLGERIYEDVTDEAKLKRVREDVVDKAPAWIVAAEGAAPVARVRQALGVVSTTKSSVTFAVAVSAEARQYGPLPAPTCPGSDASRAPTAAEWTSVRDAARVAEEACAQKLPWLGGRSVRASIVPGADAPGVACVEADAWVSPAGRACAAEIAKRLSQALPRDKRGQAVALELRFPAPPVRALCGAR